MKHVIFITTICIIYHLFTFAALAQSEGESDSLNQGMSLITYSSEFFGNDLSEFDLPFFTGDSINRTGRFGPSKPPKPRPTRPTLDEGDIVKFISSNRTLQSVIQGDQLDFTKSNQIAPLPITPLIVEPQFEINNHTEEDIQNDLQNPMKHFQPLIKQEP